MTPKIEAAKAALKQAQRNLYLAVYQQQLRCKHTTLSEAPYLPSDYGDPLPPVRVCHSCGMTEDGWCCGYLVLKGDARPVSRDHLYKMRQGLMIVAAHKGPILRREVTVRDLARAWWEARK